MDYVEKFLEEWKYLEKMKKGTMDMKVYSDFKDAIIELLKIWDKQKHSGSKANFFAPKIAYIIEKAMLLGPFVSIEEGEEEFHGTYLGGDLQSSRCFALFKNEKGSFYLHAIIWKDQKGFTFIGDINGITSRQYVKYPFVPESFVVEVGTKKDGSYAIKDTHTLYKALCYYEPFTEEARNFKKWYEEICMRVE